jgi:hypothetical protein
MATYYVDPAAGGANNGTSWTDAWTTMQSALDNGAAAAGDLNYCRGTETLAATLDVDTNAGNATDFIRFIGTNASGTVDGTKFVIDGNSAAATCLDINGVDDITFENIECKNATSHGVTASGISSYYFFYNVHSHDNGGSGFNLTTNLRTSRFLRCKAIDNTADGWEGLYLSSALFCEATGNGAIGFDNVRNGGHIIGCIVHDNTSDGIRLSNVDDGVIMHCVIDANGGHGVNGSSTRILALLGNRITNNTGDGLNITNKGFEDFNLYLSNANSIVAAADLIEIGNSLATGTEGYNDRANDDFNLTASATLRRTAVEVGTVS